MTENHKKFSEVREKITKRSPLKHACKIWDNNYFVICDEERLTLSNWSTASRKKRWKYILLCIVYFMVISNCVRFPWIAFQTIFLEKSERVLAVMLLAQWNVCYFLRSAIMLYKIKDYKGLKENFMNRTLMCVCDNCDDKIIALMKIEKIRLIFQLILVFMMYPIVTVALPLLLNDNSHCFEIYFYPVSLHNDFLYVFPLLGWWIFIIVTFQILPQLNLCWFLIEYLIIEFGVLKDKCQEVFNGVRNKQLNSECKYRNEMIIYYCTKHEEMCSILQEVNGSIKHYTSVMILNTMLGLCILFYAFLNTSFSKPELVFIGMLPIVMLLITGFILYEGLKLHQNIHDIVDDLYAMDFKDLTAETNIKLTLFLNRLTTTPMGISVGGFFVINPNSVLTILGSLLTYVIVILQTKESPPCI